MATVNEQLNIPILRPGETMYQPELYGGAIDQVTEDKALVLGTAYYRNANGGSAKNSWSGCNSCGTYSNLTGEQIDINNECGKKCLIKHPFSARKRSECVTSCKEELGFNTASSGGGTFKPTATYNTPTPKQDTTTTSKTDDVSTSSGVSGMPQNTKLLLGVGALAVVGILIFAIKRR